MKTTIEMTATTEVISSDPDWEQMALERLARFVEQKVTGATDERTHGVRLIVLALVQAALAQTGNGTQNTDNSGENTARIRDVTLPGSVLESGAKNGSTTR